MAINWNPCQIELSTLFMVTALIFQMEQDTEYTYDENGNLTKDLNKKIIDIQYNSLNLPNRV